MLASCAFFLSKTCPGESQGLALMVSNWYETNQTVAGSWGLNLGNIRMGGNVIDAAGLYVRVTRSVLDVSRTMS